MLTSQWLLCIHCLTSLVRFTAPNNTQEHSTGCETDATGNIRQFWELCGQKCLHGALLIKLKPAPQNSIENAIITDNRLKFIEAHTVIQPKREYQSTLRYQFLKFEINWTESVSSHKRRHFEKLKFLKRIDFYKHFKMIIKDNKVAWCFSDITALNSLSHLLIERGPLLLLLYFNEDKRTFVAFVLRTAKRRRWKFPFKSKFTIFQSSSRLFQLTLSNVSDLSWSWVPKNHIQVEKERKKVSSSLVCFLHNTCISLRKHPFLLALRRRARFAKRPHRRRARRNGCFRRLIHVCEIRHVAVVQWRHKMHNSYMYIFCLPFLLL